MIAATRAIVGEALRRQAGGGLDIGVELVPVPVARARGSARYAVRVSHPDLGGGEWMRIVDARGKDEALSMDAVTAWLARYLSGAADALRFDVTDASTLAAKWTARRAAAYDTRWSGLSAQALRDAAQAKRTSVVGWHGARADAVRAAADAMDQAAALADWINGAGDWPVGTEDDGGAGGGEA